MRRVVLRIGALAMSMVVLLLMAYAYGQHDTDDRYGSQIAVKEELTPLRVGTMQAIPLESLKVNPLRKRTSAGAANPLREQVAETAKGNVDHRMSKISAKTSVGFSGAGGATSDPFASKASESDTASAHAQRVRQAASIVSIPDASALEKTTALENNDQSRYSQSTGPELGNPYREKPSSKRLGATTNRASQRDGARSAPGSSSSAENTVGQAKRGVRQFSSVETLADESSRSNTKYAEKNASAREPRRLKIDPFAAPAAIRQTSDLPARRSIRQERSIVDANRGSIAEGSGEPGDKKLEGPRMPQVTLEKIAPAEIQVGKPAVLKTKIRNSGSISVNQVEIHDVLPKGTKLLSTTPQASENMRGEIVWTLGMLRPGQELTVEMEVLPIAEGVIGSVATVHIGATASAKSICTRPKLVLQSTSTGDVLLGERTTLEIIISNPGTGKATGVVLEEHVPRGLQYPGGGDLEYDVGDLRAGESKRLELTMAAVTPGRTVNVLQARADGNLHAEDRLEIQVVAPKLDLAAEGPKRRYLEREATYHLSISNPGTASARGVELAAYLPPGLNFVSANNSGHYDDINRIVYWRLEELPSQETGTVELVTMPVEAGKHQIKLRGTAERGLVVEKEQPVMVEGIAAITFQAKNIGGPIEKGGETTYEVHVENQGSKASNNVRLAVLLPKELQALAAEGPTRYSIDANHVVFEALAHLAPKADATYRVRVKGLRPGDLRARFQLTSDELRTPVTKEESTRVFADE
ncbi:MAG: hypothetical protein ACWGMZ_02255 [Thermoguttaceae bacterium]